MGAGGAAPPVKSEDVMILIGSTILLTMLVLQAWSTTDQICSMDDEKCEMFEVKYDLSEGDTFTLEVIEGEVSVTAVLPDGSTDPIHPSLTILKMSGNLLQRPLVYITSE